MYRLIVIIGVVLGIVMVAFHYFRLASFTNLRFGFELYVGLLAIAFLVIGLYVGNRLTNKKNVVVRGDFERDDNAISSLGLSKREMEVLDQIAQGYSNQEIADRLFVSLNTVKTHVNNLYVKLDVNKRTKAVSKAKEMSLIP